MTKIVLQAGLTVRYRVSPQMAVGSKLHVKLNSSNAGTIPLQTGSGGNVVLQADLNLAPDLFVGDNEVTFDLEGKCESTCTDQQNALWVEIDTSTEVQTSGTLVPVPNRLNLLPAPFITAGTQRLAELPVCF